MCCSLLMTGICMLLFFSEAYNILWKNKRVQVRKIKYSPSPSCKLSLLLIYHSEENSKNSSSKQLLLSFLEYPTALWSSLSRVSNMSQNKSHMRITNHCLEGGFLSVFAAIKFCHCRKKLCQLLRDKAQFLFIYFDQRCRGPCLILTHRYTHVPAKKTEIPF